jgi:hypothetical protein
VSSVSWVLRINACIAMCVVVLYRSSQLRGKCTCPPGSACYDRMSCDIATWLHFRRQNLRNLSYSGLWRYPPQHRPSASRPTAGGAVTSCTCIRNVGIRISCAANARGQKRFGGSKAQRRTRMGCVFIIEREKKMNLKGMEMRIMKYSDTTVS